jgi:hypothetical protein
LIEKESGGDESRNARPDMDSVSANSLLLLEKATFENSTAIPQALQDAIAAPKLDARLCRYALQREKCRKRKPHQSSFSLSFPPSLANHLNEENGKKS